MLALGIGVTALVVLGALVRSAIILGAAYALTTLVALPGAVDVLTWLVAGGFVVMQFIGVFIGLVALANAGGAARRVPRSPLRRR